MSVKVFDGLTRSSRTRARRRARGLCPDCGDPIPTPHPDRAVLKRCFKCRVKRNAKRKVLRDDHPR